MRKPSLFLLLFLASCSLTHEMKRAIIIESYPDAADVSYLSATGQFKTIGKTPYNVEDSLIKEWLGTKQEYAVIKVSKSGYAVESLFIDLNSRYKIAYNANLKPIEIWNNKETEISSNAANKLATKVQQINQEVSNKNFDRALESTEILIEQFPKAHIFYDIKGSIFYLMGYKNEALASYMKSLALNPDNNEAKKMVEKVSGERQ